jgi:hypothetical protein
MLFWHDTDPDLVRQEMLLQVIVQKGCNVLGRLGWLESLDWSYLTILGVVWRRSPHYLVERKEKVLSDLCQRNVSCSASTPAKVPDPRV